MIKKFAVCLFTLTLVSCAVGGNISGGSNGVGVGVGIGTGINF